MQSVSSELAAIKVYPSRDRCSKFRINNFNSAVLLNNLQTSKSQGRNIGLFEPGQSQPVSLVKESASTENAFQCITEYDAPIMKTIESYPRKVAKKAKKPTKTTQQQVKQSKAVTIRTLTPRSMLDELKPVVKPKTSKGEFKNYSSTGKKPVKTSRLTAKKSEENPFGKV